jgi:hypothetical protein
MLHLVYLKVRHVNLLAWGSEAIDASLKVEQKVRHVNFLTLG